MAEKKGFFASLFGGGGCSCGMSIEEEKADNKRSTKKKGGCCDMQIIEESACSCGKIESSQQDSECGCSIPEEKDNTVSNSCCCGDSK